MDKPKKTFGGRQDGAGRPALPDEQQKRRAQLFVHKSAMDYLDALDIADENERRAVARKRKRYAAAHLEVYCTNKRIGSDPISIIP